MHLAPGDPERHDDIGGRMGLREHVFYGVAGPDVPVRDPVLSHLLAVGIMIAVLRELALTYELHDFERASGLQSHIDQVDHDVVTGADRGLNRTLSFGDQLLGVSDPDVGTMCQTCDADKVGYIFRLGL